VSYGATVFNKLLVYVMASLSLSPTPFHLQILMTYLRCEKLTGQFLDLIMMSH
jgi:hypothetical protein